MFCQSFLSLLIKYKFTFLYFYEYFSIINPCTCTLYNVWYKLTTYARKRRLVFVWSIVRLSALVHYANFPHVKRVIEIVRYLDLKALYLKILGVFGQHANLRLWRNWICILKWNFEDCESSYLESGL